MLLSHVSRSVFPILILAMTLSVATCGKDSPTKPDPPVTPPIPPTPPPPASVPSKVQISPSMSEFMLAALAQTVQLTAQVWDQDNRPINDAQVAWSSGDTRVASVNTQGLVTAVGVGTVKITARSGNATSSVEVWVSQVVTKFVVEPSMVMLSTVGETVQLTAIVQDSNENPVRQASVAWMSHETDIATVNDQGLVTAVGNGSTVIVASYRRLRVEVPVTVSVRSPDREVLVLLYNQTNGANWTRSHNWLSEKPVSEWANVAVDGQGNVKGLGLNSNNLKGQIPGELAQLSHLEELNLSDNELEGAIPSELGSLAKLERLVLNSNQLTGSIPQEIGQLSEIKALFLQENRLTGSIPAELGQLTHLTALVLSLNQLSGSLPPELGELTQLEALFLNNNPDLTGPLPREFLNLRNVRLYAQNTALCAPWAPSSITGYWKLHPQTALPLVSLQVRTATFWSLCTMKWTGKIGRNGRTGSQTSPSVNGSELRPTRMGKCDQSHFRIT